MNIELMCSKLMILTPEHTAIFSTIFYWTFGGIRKDSVKWSPSVRLSISLSGHFFGIELSVVLSFAMVLETHMKLCVTEPDFLETFFCPGYRGNGPKIRSSEFIEKFSS